MSDLTTIEHYLISSIDEIVNFLKALSQSSRLKILILTLNKSRSFKDLLFETGLQKTALNVHINLLLEQKLLMKEERGLYRTTITGDELIRVSALVLKDARIRRILDEGKMSIGGFESRGAKNIMKKVINGEVKYQNAWLSYIATVTGVLKYYGFNTSLDEVAGYSGYSFLLNMAEAFTCPSGPTAHPPAVWEEIHKGTESVGVTINHWSDNESFPETEYAISSRDQNRAKILFEKVKSILDTSEKPVILWGLPVPEYGIVIGYEENSYLVSTFRHLNRIPDSPIKYDALQAPGCLELIFLEPNKEKIFNERDFKALERIYRFAKGNYTSTKGYKNSLSAIEQWIEHLEQEDPKKYPYHGNSYLGVCTQEASELSSQFLERLNKKLKNKDLEKTSKSYKDASISMKGFREVFPFGFDGVIKKDQRILGIKYLHETYENLENALSTLENVIN